MKNQILLVDDEPFILEFLKYKLENSGYEVAVARNGQEGLEKLQSVRPSVVVTDIVMPVMDGIDFYKNLKEIQKTRNIPVIVSSAWPDKKGCFEGLSDENFLTKPFEAIDLINRIEKILTQSDQLKKDNRIIIAGEDVTQMRVMIDQLEEDGLQLSSEIVTNGIDVISKTIALKPNVVFIDCLMKTVPAANIINDLRAVSELRDLPIVTYTSLSEAQMSNTFIVRKLDMAQNACLGAGANQFIGPISKFVFILALYEYC